jgi:hypothetical protein
MAGEGHILGSLLAVLPFRGPLLSRANTPPPPPLLLLAVRRRSRFIPFPLRSIPTRLAPLERPRSMSVAFLAAFSPTADGLPPAFDSPMSLSRRRRRRRRGFLQERTAHASLDGADRCRPRESSPSINVFTVADSARSRGRSMRLCSWYMRSRGWFMGLCSWCRRSRGWFRRSRGWFVGCPCRPPSLLFRSMSIFLSFTLLPTSTLSERDSERGSVTPCARCGAATLR